MCLSVGNQSAFTIDSLFGGIDIRSRSTQDQAQGPIDPLTSLRYPDNLLGFSIVDSLTLAKQRMSPSDLSSGSGNLDDELDGEGMSLWEQDEVEDEVDAAGSEFDSSWQGVMKANPVSSLRHSNDTRRSGVRRGYHETADCIKIMAVPTKYHDGPSAHKCHFSHAPATTSTNMAPNPRTSPAA